MERASTAKRIFKHINTVFEDPEIVIYCMADDPQNPGQKVFKETTDMDNAELFSFKFNVDGHHHGPVAILLSSDDELGVYYGDNIGKTLDGDARKKWDGLIQFVRNLSIRTQLKFSLNNWSDLKYATYEGKTGVSKNYKTIVEGYYGTSKTSYNPMGEAKIIIKHSKRIGEGDARFRNISSIFIENANGERFKLPFKKLAGARAMARHVTEGGNPYDVFGMHISEMVKNINTLGGFVRSSKAYEHLEEAQGLIETGRKHYAEMRKSLKQISGKRGYHTYKESWEPAEITERDHDVNSIRGLFTEKSVNARIEEALPLLAQLQELAEIATPDDTRSKEPAFDKKEMDDALGWDPFEKMMEPDEELDEVAEFEQWANTIIEGPENKVDMLRDFMAQEQPVGVDAINVMNEIGEYFNDESFEEALKRLAEQNPDADAREVVAKWISNNDMELAHALNLHGEYDNPAARDFPREDCNSDLDADSDTQLNASVNKDLDKYTHTPDKKVETKELTMKDLKDYMAEVDNGMPQDVMESKEEAIKEPKEDDTSLDELIQRTNHLLRK